MTLHTEIAGLGPWDQNIILPDGTQTAPESRRGDSLASRWRALAPHLPDDLRGWRALDVGCNAGFFAFELAKRGASVVGTDADSRPLAQARWAARQLGLDGRTEFHRMQVYDLAALAGDYDLALFLGGMDGLRYPRLALDIVAQKVRRLLALQTPLPAGDDVEAWLRAAGLHIGACPDAGTYLCRPDAGDTPPVWDTEEFVAATGRRPGLFRTLRFQHCDVQFSPGLTQTFFHDGTHVVATSEDSAGYRANAARYGYGDDLAALSREHEVLHTFLAEALGYGSSPTLWAVAHGQRGQVAPVWEQEEEETWVLAFQTYLNGTPPGPPLERFVARGLSLPALRAEAHRLLRGHP